MSSFEHLLQSVVLPHLFSVRQRFRDDALVDVALSVTRSLDQSRLAERLTGREIAIGVGSRGIANLGGIVRTVVDWFRQHGSAPFIFPAMGSHGGASAEGQRDVLAHLGITEDSAGCSIRSTMDTVCVGTLDNGLPVYLDKMAARADGIFMINRIKPHTGFSGEHESGLVKMAVIGLGKQRGAEACHYFGYAHMAENLPRACALLLERCPHILGGLGLVENAYDKTCHVEAIPRETFLARDAALLHLARERMGRLYVQQVDVLLMQRMGKEISGAGMDPNIIGRAASPYKRSEIDCTKIGVLRLTDSSQGNACGVGIADVIPRHLFDKIDPYATYTNVMTSTMLRAAHIPVVMPTEHDAIRCLVKTSNPQSDIVRLVFLRDTLSLENIWVSEPVARELSRNEFCDVDMTPHAFVFDGNGICTTPSW
ncbi:lactate racemase domain-containing protein [Bilophila wadsworthia]|uniref:lactate racemase domain-containing protein n=1 Tax=Bilophila wadsworthia TaxID=35833 RepID=UPI00243249FF|nr:lactate racemase domain-containing protein [Bilophila wadsworthia]